MRFFGVVEEVEAFGFQKTGLSGMLHRISGFRVEGKAKEHPSDWLKTKQNSVTFTRKPPLKEENVLPQNKLVCFVCHEKRTCLNV